MSNYPPDWKIANLSDLATITASNVDKKTKEGQRDVLLCNYMDVFKNSVVSSSLEFMRSTASQKEISEFSVSKGDVLLTKDSEVPEEIGIPSVVIDDIPDLVCGYHLYMIRADHSRINPEYLCWTLRSNSSRQYFYQMANGSTRFGLNLKHIEECPVAIPPLPEQKKIAEILFGVDEFIASLQRKVLALEKLNNGIMLDSFAFAAMNAMRGNYHHSDLLSISVVGDVFEVQLGKMLNKEAKKSGTQFNYLGNKNIQRWQLCLDELESMHFSDAERRKFSLVDGDLLVCEGGDAGRCCLWEGGETHIYYQKAIHRLRSKDGSCSNKYAMFYLTHCKENGLLENFISRTSIAHLTREKLMSIPIAFPSKSKQEKIVRQIDSCRLVIESLKMQISSSYDVKRSLSSDLLSGRKRVSI